MQCLQACQVEGIESQVQGRSLEHNEQGQCDLRLACQETSKKTKDKALTTSNESFKKVLGQELQLEGKGWFQTGMRWAELKML